MRGTIRLCAILMLISWFSFGCGGSAASLKKVPPTINTVKSSDRYAKRVALALTMTPSTAAGQGAGSIYFKSLIQAIAQKDSRFRLVAPGDDGFPDFMAELARGAVEDPDAPVLCRRAREAGYQGLVVAAVRDIRVSTIRTGLLWFRKTRYLIHFNVTADCYDPYSAAKIVSGVAEQKVRIDENDYEDYLSGRATAIEPLEEEIAEAAETLGGRIGKALSHLAWKASVAGIDGGRVLLPVGSVLGLREGDRLAVFEGRRELTGQQGERFIAPGYQVGMVQVTAVADNAAEVRVSSTGDIKKGDIVVPIR